ncbi:MAG TPA: VanZ family protein [Lacipirellulaceae bacterium]|nr:VanZ family protein [Lacipirellulaceae bacterium]
MAEPRPTPGDRLSRLAMRARTLAAVYLVILFVATHIPAMPTRGFSMSDKVHHLAGYSMLTFCVLAGWELTIGVLAARHYFAVWLAGTLYAALDEVTQIPVGRRCDVDDWAADILGLVLGILAFRLLRGTLYRLLLIKEPAPLR